MTRPFSKTTIGIALGALALGAALMNSSATPANAGGGCHAAPDEREGAGDEVRLEENCFAPTVLRIEPGTQVTFTNADEAAHEIAGVAGEFGTTSAMLKGDTLTASFSQPGLYPYSCPLHPGMVGVIAVGEDAPAAVAAVSAVAAPADDGGGDEGWLYGGLGALGGLVVAGGLAGAVIARRR